MSQTCGKRGSVPVGYLSELDGVEETSVIYLRLWADSARGKAEIWQDMATHLGPEKADRATDAFSQLCRLCGRYGRRPLMRHATNCKCLGADEACFANFVAAAAEGARDDAMLMATLLVRPDVAPLITSLATSFGLLLKQMNLAQSHDLDCLQPTAPTTLH